ncbi:hypothetical protein pEaSNUABM54_00241 [Erwinia phage pEa_SNUABM_54]|nr:hypothetical protein pEaSNUABM54_00241 [Erwinia phage pEa_SNUABM_54]
MSLVLREGILCYGTATFDKAFNITALNMSDGACEGTICHTGHGVELPGRVVLISSVYYRVGDRAYAIGVWGRDHTGKWYKVSTDVPNVVAKQITEELQKRCDYTLSKPRVKLPRSDEDRNVERLAAMCGFSNGIWLYDDQFKYERYFTDGVFFDPYNNGVHQWKLITSARLNVRYNNKTPVAQKEGVGESVELTSYTSLNLNRQLCNYIVKHCLKD